MFRLVNTLIVSIMMGFMGKLGLTYTVIYEHLITTARYGQHCSVRNTHKHDKT